MAKSKIGSSDHIAGDVTERLGFIEPTEATKCATEAEKQDCPECGHPKDDSSGQGHCEHECHGAA